jgi:exonuclease III
VGRVRECLVAVILINIMDHSCILIWNVRVLNSAACQHSVRDLVGSARVDVVCLQETKMLAISRRVLLSMLGSDFDSNFISLPSAGASRGILVAWRNALGVTGATRIDSFSVSVQFCPSSGEPWWLTCVYGPQGNEEKIAFLQELRDIRGHCQGPWLVVGDFNMI